MSPRRRAPWTALLVAAVVVSGTGASGQTGLVAHGGPTLAAAATAGMATGGVPPRPPLRVDGPAVPPLPVPPVPVPVAPASARSARQLPLPPLPGVPLPSVPLPSVPLSPGNVSPLPAPALPVSPLPRSGPTVPVLPGLRPPPGVLPLPRLDRRLLASAGALPLAGGPTDTRPGPGPSFTLEARSITLNGVRLRGLTTPPGRRKPVREPVVRIDVDDATLTVPIIRALHARRGVVEARSEQVARLTGRGQIYIEEITGTLNVAGLPTVPVRLSPGELTTPGLDLGFLELPSLTFADVTARVAFLQAGRLTIPGATFVASVPAR